MTSPKILSLSASIFMPRLSEPSARCTSPTTAKETAPELAPLGDVKRSSAAPRRSKKNARHIEPSCRNGVRILDGALAHGSFIFS